MTQEDEGRTSSRSVVECGGRDARAPCIGDTAVEGGKYVHNSKHAVRQTTAVSRQGLPHALHNAAATLNTSLLILYEATLAPHSVRSHYELSRACDLKPSNPRAGCSASVRVAHSMLRRRQRSPLCVMPTGIRSTPSSAAAATAHMIRRISRRGSSRDCWSRNASPMAIASASPRCALPAEAPPLEGDRRLPHRARLPDRA